MIYWEPEIQNKLNGLERKRFLGKKLLIKYLYAYGGLSGPVLSQLVGLSLPTVNGFLNNLISEGIIEIRGKGESEGGRRPNIYCLVKNSVYLMGIDISQHSFSVAIFNNEFENITGIKTRSKTIGNDFTYVDEVYKLVQKQIKECTIEEKKIMGVGISMPGLIDSGAGISHTYLYAKDKSLQEIFQEKFEIPVYIENDSNARALAELRHGAAKGTSNTLVLQLDWGIGAGMILNGSLHNGKSGFSGEFSHILIEENGRLCACGKRGCLETIVSGEALIRKAIEALKNDKNSVLHQCIKDKEGKLFIQDVVSAAQNSDQLAIALINDLGQKLGKGISYLIQILNPELIIFGGAISQANEYLLTPINQALFTYCIPKLREETKLLISGLGTDIGVLGAASVALDRSMNN